MNRLLIFGILNDGIFREVRRHQRTLSHLTGNELALKFPVHITLRGPFWTGTEIHTLSNLLDKVCRRHRRVQVPLSGPVFVDPNLCWFEVDPTSTGFAGLLSLHNHFEEEVNQYVVVDDVPADHKGENYRPHITVGWGTNPATDYDRFLRPTDLTATLEGVAIAGYPEGWPSKGTVEIITSVALDEQTR